VEEDVDDAAEGREAAEAAAGSFGHGDHPETSSHTSPRRMAGRGTALGTPRSHQLARREIPRLLTSKSGARRSCR